jgi:hypothetical protein
LDKNYNWGVLSVAKSGTMLNLRKKKWMQLLRLQRLWIAVAAHAHGDDGMQRAIKAYKTSMVPK